MDSPVLHEFRRQASLFLREKIRTARLALTDVTPPQLLAEEATNGDLSAPNMQTMRLISRAAFEADDYWRIADILHKRFVWPGLYYLYLNCLDQEKESTILE
uniref:ENTH domain-containing protein n=1 Tax=Nicotiana tabacum TaxID=4097 RepID=A0A1S3X4Z8_TOBAC|nr:PREDICTED: uncharacterized protein LOC107761254 [Nicotiana tabacum]